MFLELRDARIINTDSILELDPRLSRIKFTNGGQQNLEPEDVEKLKNVLLGPAETTLAPKRRGRPPKNTDKEEAL